MQTTLTDEELSYLIKVEHSRLVFVYKLNIKIYYFTFLLKVIR